MKSRFSFMKPWLTWIALNSISFSALGLFYLDFKSHAGALWEKWMFFASLTGHMPLFALGFGFACLPAVLLMKNHKHIKIFSAFWMTILVIMLLSDFMVFSQYRFHLNLAYLKMAMDPQIMPISSTVWELVATIIVLLFCFQYSVLHFLLKYPSVWSVRCMKAYASFTLCVMIAFHTSYAWAKAHDMYEVVSFQEYLPFYSGLSATTLIKKLGLRDEELLRKNQTKKLDKISDKGLSYPLQELKYKAVDKPLHIFILMVDTWRYDTFNADNMPHLSKWTQSGKILSHHYSSGNRTWAGVSGFFFGLSPSYWRRLETEQVSPVLTQRLVDLNYQMGVFASAHLKSPALNRTVFKVVSNLRVESEGKTPAARDLSATEDWLRWIDTTDTSKPIFSFLFYDAAHGLSIPKDYSHRYEPMVDYVNYVMLNNSTDTTPIMNRYKTSVHYIDSLLGRVFEKLDRKGLLDNSVIIVTGDHGEEWNDNGLNYWKHGSNFTDPQVKVPMVWMAPDQDGIQTETHQLTSHLDVAPTLLEHYLGAETETKFYGIGHNLFKPFKRDFVLSVGANHYALIEKDRISVISNHGRYWVYDKKYRPVEEEINLKFLQQAMEQVSRFN